MKRPDFIAARHFPSPYNEQGISRGWLPIGIDKAEAKKLMPEVVRVFEKYGVDTIISSDLPRGTQSAELIADNMDPEPETESYEALNTWDTGTKVAGKKESETIPLRQKYIKNPEIAMPGGESWQDFIDRFKPELEDIVERRKNGEEIAFIAHGHHLLAIPHLLKDEEVDAKKLPTLDEDYEPGHAFLFFIEGDTVRIECEECEDD